MPGIFDAVQVAAGGAHSCARRSGGTVLCWGHDYWGALGHGSAMGGPGETVTVSGLSDAVAVEAGFYSTCALRATGTVVCWGRGFEGQLGNGAMVNSDVPVPVSLLTDVAEIAVGTNHACARTRGGSIACWGASLGSTPTPIVP